MPRRVKWFNRIIFFSHSTMDFSIKCLLCIIGVNYVRIEEKVIKTVFSSNLLLLLGICGVALFYRKIIFTSYSIIMQISDVGCFAIPAASHFVILIEMFRNRKEIFKTLEVIEKLHRILNCCKRFIETDSTEVILLVLCTAVEISITYYAKYYKLNWVYHWLVTEYAFIICHIGTLCHIYYINLLNTSLEAINDRLVSIVESSKWNRGNILAKSFFKTLLEIDNSLLVCFNVNEKINKLFEWSVLINSINYFISLAFDTFFCLISIQNFLETGNLHFIGKFSWCVFWRSKINWTTFFYMKNKVSALCIFPPLTMVILINHRCENTSRKLWRIVSSWHEIQKNFRDVQMHTLVGRYDVIQQILKMNF